MSDQHNALIKTPRQLITVVILAFVVPVIVIILLVNFVTGSKTGGAGSDAMTAEAVADRMKPVGVEALQQAAGARALQSGEAVYQASCTSYFKQIPPVRFRPEVNQWIAVPYQ